MKSNGRTSGFTPPRMPKDEGAAVVVVVVAVKEVVMIVV